MESTMAAFAIALCALTFGMGVLVFTGIEMGIEWYKEWKGQ